MKGKRKQPIHREIRLVYHLYNEPGTVIVDGSTIRGEPKVWAGRVGNGYMFEVSATEAYVLAKTLLQAVSEIKLNGKRGYQDRLLLPDVPRKPKKTRKRRAQSKYK